MSDAQVALLKAHARLEHAALVRADRAQSIRLSGEFHLPLIETRLSPKSSAQDLEPDPIAELSRAWAKATRATRRRLHASVRSSG